MTIGLIIRDGAGTARTISELFIRDGGNVSREISELWVRDADNVSRLVFDPGGAASLSVLVSPDSLDAFSAGTGTATTAAATAVASGGTAPYTYAWVLIGSGIPAPSADSPTAAASTFTQSGMAPNEIYPSIWVCDVTDDNAIVARSNEIFVNFADIS